MMFFIGGFSVILKFKELFSLCLQDHHFLEVGHTVFRKTQINYMYQALGDLYFAWKRLIFIRNFYINVIHDSYLHGKDPAPLA